MKSGVITMDRLTASDEADRGVRMNNARLIPIASIVPNPKQPRTNFVSPEMQAYIEELANSIRKRGLLQPIAVLRKADGTHQLIAGECRLRAAKLLKWSDIPAIIREYEGEAASIMTAQLAIDALVENEQRKNLAPADVAKAIGDLVVDGFTPDFITDETGMSAASVTRYTAISRNPDLMVRLTAGESLEKLYSTEVVPRNREAGETRGRKKKNTQRGTLATAGHADGNDGDYHGTDEPDDGSNSYAPGQTSHPQTPPRTASTAIRAGQPHDRLATRQPGEGISFKFRGQQQYISAVEASEMLAALNAGLLEEPGIADSVAPYDAQELYEQWQQLGMTIKGKLASSLAKYSLTQPCAGESAAWDTAQLNTSDPRPVTSRPRANRHR